jgi:hypothetical protein
MFDSLDKQTLAIVKAAELQRHQDKLAWIESQILHYSSQLGLHVSPGDIFDVGDDQTLERVTLSNLCSEYVELAQFIQKMESPNGTK